MSLTPDLITGSVATSAWGNEIRNRSTQVFANAAELQAWAAPNGSVGVDLATNTPYLRRGSAWLALSFTHDDFTQGQANANGDLAIAHPLGAIPRGIQVTPSFEINLNTAMLTITARTSTTFTVRARNYSGAVQASANIGIYWSVAL